MTADFEQMWRDLAPVGRSSSSGGYDRSPFLAAEREATAWFLEQCAQRSLEVQRDLFGNLAAWWWPTPVGSPGEPVETPGVLTGSHLDSVPDGGAYDGPLGVVSALAAIDLLRDRGVRPARPLGVGVFAEEEGSRFGLACLGSRLATGSLPWARAAALTDRDGISLEDAVADVQLGEADLLAGVGCFVELHVEQGRDLVHRDAAVGVASGIWPHGRFRFDFTGEANHAGTTRMEDRHDPMLTYAMTALAANKQARLAGQRATFGRVDVHPNGTNAVPSRVTAWLDARAETGDELQAMLTAVERLAQDRAGRDGTALAVTPESVSPAVHFEESLARRIAGPAGWPVIPTMAGHDAGVLSAAGVPTAMLFVRNPTGVSHAPVERAETADCLAGVEALADTLQELTR
ncbi:MAG: beta-ureidopropionase / N-carbamoyl-L-amino-acid hydrolase [Nocardioidaceae bacterium]|nr:beta-ureidopropionase / N-carbamoyl-L-amino-acid hydrolase [Nocardioidaceae bacterium]